MDALTPKHIEVLKEQLMALEAELVEMLAMSEGAADPVSLDQPIGRVSRIDAIQQQKMIAAGRNAQKLRLQLVRSALTAVADKVYGECKQCEEPIGFARLQARPESPLCVTCQGLREQSQ